jgi:conserved domain protein
MIKNIQSLMDKSKNFAKEKGLSVQEVLQNYMFERFLERLSKSEYNENFIIKGRFFIIFYNGN